VARSLGLNLVRSGSAGKRGQSECERRHTRGIASRASLPRPSISLTLNPERLDAPPALLALLSTHLIRVKGPSPVLNEEIRDLALRCGILTEYTSYLVQELELVANALASMPRVEEAREPTGARSSSALAEVLSSRRQRLYNMRTCSPQGWPQAWAYSRGRQAKPVAGRMFVLRGSVWTDIGKVGRISVTAGAAFSPAYFAVVRMLPGLTLYLSAGEDVPVAGRRGSIRIAHQGRILGAG
jgi:hypothetical protein